MKACRKSLGQRGIFDNHDLDSKPPCGISKLYDMIKKVGGPVELQTYHETPDDFDATIKLGMSLGAGSIELWQDFKSFPLESDAKLKRWAAMLEK